LPFKIGEDLCRPADFAGHGSAPVMPLGESASRKSRLQEVRTGRFRLRLMTPSGVIDTPVAPRSTAGIGCGYTGPPVGRRFADDRDRATLFFSATSSTSPRWQSEDGPSLAAARRERPALSFFHWPETNGVGEHLPARSCSIQSHVSVSPLGKVEGTHNTAAARFGLSPVHAAAMPDCDLESATSRERGLFRERDLITAGTNSPSCARAP
jgi:hypothetical protein